MGRYDNENIIISEARSVPTEQTCFLTKSPFERSLYRAVIKEWPKWTINNGHDNIPPDYFSRDHKLMFDVMRINDSESAITTKRGKVLLYNPAKVKECSMLHEVQSFAKELSLNCFYFHTISPFLYSDEKTYLPIGSLIDINSITSKLNEFFYRILKAYHCAEVCTQITKWAFLLWMKLSHTLNT